MPSISITPREAKCRIGFLQPRRAVRVDAPAGGFACLPHDIAAAHRTVLRHAERLALVALLQHPHHFRDHVAAALDQNRVADLHAQPLDLILVVQRGARDGHPAHHHGLQMRHGRQCAGAAHLHLDSSITVCSCRGGNLIAIAQRGALAVQPSIFCCAMESTLATTPSISYGRVRAWPPIRGRTRATRRGPRTCGGAG